VLVPPGKFRMGSPTDEAGHNPWEPNFDSEVLHEVTLTQPFDLGRYEVTQAQYQALTGNSPSGFKGDDNPVEQVTWDEARDFAVRLTGRRGDRHQYRLPTEAEWEYACRGGRPTSQPFGVGDGLARSSRDLNCNGNFPYAGAERGPDLHATCRVGSYAANALGLFDMHGNVWEWCADAYGPCPADSVTDPTGPPAGPNRVHRGGSWFDAVGNCRSALRANSPPGRRGNHIGFRLARTLPAGGK
jgi:formylglycine-generating enzyme required for sulfatase activity